MVSSPSFPYDGRRGDEFRVTAAARATGRTDVALNASRVSTSSAPSRHRFRTSIQCAPLPLIVMVSSPACPYDVEEMRSESRPHALNASRAPPYPRRGGHFLRAPSRHWFRTAMVVASSPVIVMVSSPAFPYDVGEMRSESRPHALNASRASTSSPRRGGHFLRAPSRH